VERKQEKKEKTTTSSFIWRGYNGNKKTSEERRSKKGSVDY
jgi:hypothetical protein